MEDVQIVECNSLNKNLKCLFSLHWLDMNKTRHPSSLGTSVKTCYQSVMGISQKLNYCCFGPKKKTKQLSTVYIVSNENQAGQRIFIKSFCLFLKNTESISARFCWDFFIIIFYYEKPVLYMLPRHLMGIADLAFHFSNFLCGADSLLHFFSILCRRLSFSKIPMNIGSRRANFISKLLTVWSTCLWFRPYIFVHGSNHALLSSQVFYFHFIRLNIYSYYTTRLTEKTRAFKVCLEWNSTDFPTRMNWILQTFKIATCPCCSFSHTYN